jgi:RNA polymerase sigma-70 factor (ECF subfamily)
MNERMPVSRRVEGEAPAFDILADQHAGRLRRYLIGRGLTRDDADDLTQDTLINAFAGLGSLRNASRVSSWMYGIARRVYVDWLRQGARREVPVDDVRSTARVPDPSTCDLRIAVRHALDSVPAHYRSVLILKDLEGMTLAETADALGVPETTVVNWLARARRQMKSILVAEGIRLE